MIPMSAAPREVSPKHRVNDYTVVISKGAEHGVSEGDSFVVELDEEDAEGVAIDVGQREAVLELERTDVESYV